jgi:hypothetical protein
LQDSLKQHRPFHNRAVTVFLSESHHRILDDVQCGLLIADGEHGLFEGASLYAGEEVG